MSKTPKRVSREEDEFVLLREGMGGVTFLDPFREPAFLPPADVNENSAELVIRLELPGVRENEVAVFVQGATIEVIGEKTREACGAEASFLCLERAFGKFRRTFELSGCLNMGKARAMLKDGVLVLCVPKCEERRGKRRRIRVEAEE